MQKHDLFSTFWKSRMSFTKDNYKEVLKEIDDEVKYFSVAVLPYASGQYAKRILKRIENLRDNRKELEKRYKEWFKAYDEKRFPRGVREVAPVNPAEESSSEEKTFGLDDHRVNSPRKSQIQKDEWQDHVIRTQDYRGVRIREFSSSLGKYFTTEVDTPSQYDTIAEAKAAIDKYFKSHPEEEMKSQVQKDGYSFINKKKQLKDLYVKAWGSLTGLKNEDLEKMSDEDLDKAINSLQSLYDNKI